MGCLNLDDIPFAQMRRLPTPDEIRSCEPIHEKVIDGKACIIACLYCGGELSADLAVLRDDENIMAGITFLIHCKICTFTMASNEHGIYLGASQ